MSEEVPLQAQPQGPHQHAHGQPAARVQALPAHLLAPRESMHAHQALPLQPDLAGVSVRDLQGALPQPAVAEAALHVAPPEGRVGRRGAGCAAGRRRRCRRRRRGTAAGGGGSARGERERVSRPRGQAVGGVGRTHEDICGGDDGAVRLPEQRSAKRRRCHGHRET